MHIPFREVGARPARVDEDWIRAGQIDTLNPGWRGRSRLPLFDGWPTDSMSFRTVSGNDSAS